MAYFQNANDYAGAGGHGCGPRCGCASCQEKNLALAEYYYEGEGRDEPRRGGAGARGLGEPAPVLPAATQLTRVADASVPPWRAVCRIVARQDDAGFSVGTGILVSPHHVLTAAHVILPPQAPRTREIVVHPGQNGPDASSTGYKANGWAVSPRWRSTDCMTAGEDFGIIRLPVQHGFVPLIPFDPADLLLALVTMAGYPSTREPAARHMFQSQGRVLGAIQINACTATTAEGRLIPTIPATANLIAHNLNSEPSLSGGPLWFHKDTRRLAAIHTGTVANGTMRKAIILNGAVRAQIFDWMRRTLPPLRA